jgi:hypothetical protein
LAAHWPGADLVILFRRSEVGKSSRAEKDPELDVEIPVVKFDVPKFETQRAFCIITSTFRREF